MKKNTINKATVQHRLSDQYLFMVNEVFKDGISQGEGLSVFFYDNAEEKMKCKSIYGMGFVVNYIEESRSDNGFILIADSVCSSRWI